jgi:nucleotide-binding universal stress UspA family protein
MSIVIVYERSAAGRAALLHAHSLAVDAGARLTVVAVGSRERTDIGCGSCRQGAAFRNQLAREGAEVALSDARTMLASVPPPPALVGYELARGTFRRAVAQAACEHRAEVIVVPARGGRLRRRFSRDRVAMLQARTAGSVVVAAEAG